MTAPATPRSKPAAAPSDDVGPRNPLPAPQAAALEATPDYGCREIIVAASNLATRDALCGNQTSWCLQMQLVKRAPS